MPSHGLCHCLQLKPAFGGGKTSINLGGQFCWTHASPRRGGASAKYAIQLSMGNRLPLRPQAL